MHFQRRRPLQTTLDQSLRERILHVPLQCPSQRSRPIVAIAAGLIENPLTRFRSQDNLHLAMDQRVVDLADQQIDDAQEIVVGKRVEENNFVQPVQEFGIEDPLTSPITISSMDLPAPSSPMDWKPRAERFCRWRAPRFEVMIRMVLRKSTVLPRPSVSWPSSNTCNRML